LSAVSRVSAALVAPAPVAISRIASIVRMAGSRMIFRDLPAFAAVSKDKVG
jgi:hypothetical protein